MPSELCGKHGARRQLEQITPRTVKYVTRLSGELRPMARELEHMALRTFWNTGSQSQLDYLALEANCTSVTGSPTKPTKKNVPVSKYPPKKYPKTKGPGYNYKTSQLKTYGDKMSHTSKHPKPQNIPTTKCPKYKKSQLKNVPSLRMSKATRKKHYIVIIQ